MALRLSRPSFGGNAETLRIGTAKFGLPPGCRTHRVKRGRAELAYVMTPDGQVHALTARGEVVGIPGPLVDLVRARLFDG